MTLRIRRSSLRVGTVLLALGTLLPGTSRAATWEDRREAPVGISARIDELVLPGSKLEARPIELEDPVVVRVRHVYAHGENFRYDLEWSALEPGEHDLSRFLQRVDGTDTQALPPIPVVATTKLPPGQVEPSALPAKEVGGIGGYRLLGVLAAVAWVLGLLALLFVGRRKPEAGAAGAGKGPVSLADRLRPLVQRAVSGELSGAERAELEMALLVHWKRRLGLADRPMAETMRVLREHAEAGPLLRALEEWLHRPVPRHDLDLDVLLSPYREVTDESFAFPPALQGAR